MSATWERHIRERLRSEQYQRNAEYRFVMTDEPLTREQAVVAVRAGIWEAFSGWDSSSTDEVANVAVDAINAVRPGSFRAVNAPVPSAS